MRRKFFVEVECNLDITGPFDVHDIQESLAEKFSCDGDIKCTGFYCAPYAWNWQETTNPDDIVNEITCELTFHAEELGASGASNRHLDVLFGQCHGDNSDDDIGYEIRWLSNPQILFDLYLKKEKGIWNVYLDKSGKSDLHIACIEDLIECYNSSN